MIPHDMLACCTACWQLVMVMVSSMDGHTAALCTPSPDSVMFSAGALLLSVTIYLIITLHPLHTFYMHLEL